MIRVTKATGAKVQTTVNDVTPDQLGTCEVFEEKQVGNERFNLFRGCPASKTCTMVLRGGAEQFNEEAARSLNDAIEIVRRAVKNAAIVPGGGAIDMELSRYLRDHARTIPGKGQLFINAFAKALEVIPRRLCDNSGFDATASSTSSGRSTPSRAGRARTSAWTSTPEGSSTRTSGSSGSPAS